MKFGLPEKTIEKINGVFAKYSNIEKVIIYGSRAMGNYKNGSDIDLVMVGNAHLKEDWGKIFSDLDDLLTPYSFDLSILSQIDNPNLLEHIHRVGKIFYQH